MADLTQPLSRITVYKRGWRYEKHVDCSGLRAGWGINAPESLSCLIPIRDQRLTGEDWLGRWVEWEHPTMGRIAGTVEDNPIDTGRGTMELHIVGHVNILNYRRTTRRYRPASGPPGAIVTRALSDITLDAGMPFTITASERGPQLTYEFRAQMISDVFSAMTSASGQEWRAWTDDSRTLQIEWKAKVGRDETSRVTFTEGVNVIDARIDGTLFNTVNDLLAIADDQQYSRAQGARIQAQGSVGRFGRRQGTRQYTGLVAKSTLGPRAQRDIKDLSRPTFTVTLRVPHTEPKLAYIREGTEFRYISAAANAVFRLRALTRDIDLDSGVVTLTCDGVSDITRATKQSFYTWGGITTSGG